MGPGIATNTGDTAWVLSSAALVLFMTPGLALFYGGLVRKKNVLATMMQSFVMMALISVLWCVYGYSLAFGEGSAFFGSFKQNFMLVGVGGAPNEDYAATIPHQTFMLFQLMFAIITPALITGAFAERMKFNAMLLFLALWALVVVGLIDNLLRPLLIRGGVHLHGALVFFSLIGALAAFGGVGLFLGPLALVFFLATVRTTRQAREAEA